MNFNRYLGLLILIASTYVIWQIRDLLLLLFTAIVLAIAMERLVRLLQRWIKHRALAILSSVIVLSLLAIALFLLIVPAFFEQFLQLLDLLPDVFLRIQAGLNWLETRLAEQDFIDVPNLDPPIQQLQPYITELFNQVLSFFSSSVGAILRLILVIILAIMLLINPQQYRNLAIQLFPSFYRQRARKIFSRCKVALGNWTTGVLIQMAFVALMSGIGLWILQVPLALAHAILAGLLDLIPNIGPTIAAVFPIAIALLDEPWKAIAVLILYVVIQNVESYALMPVIMAKQVELLPAITLIAQIVFASFFGFLGLLMALPLTIAAKTWLEELLLKDILDRWQQFPSR